jgi:hypothetical protein
VYEKVRIRRDSYSLGKIRTIPSQIVARKKER